jgi:hypothetical protein
LPPLPLSVCQRLRRCRALHPASLAGPAKQPPLPQRRSQQPRLLFPSGEVWGCRCRRRWPLSVPARVRAPSLHAPETRPWAHGARCRLATAVRRTPRGPHSSGGGGQRQQRLPHTDAGPRHRPPQQRPTQQRRRRPGSGSGCSSPWSARPNQRQQPPKAAEASPATLSGASAAGRAPQPEARHRTPPTGHTDHPAAPVAACSTLAAGQQQPAAADGGGPQRRQRRGNGGYPWSARPNRQRRQRGGPHSSGALRPAAATKATGFRRVSWVFFSLGRVAEDRCFCCRGGPPTCVLADLARRAAARAEALCWPDPPEVFQAFQTSWNPREGPRRASPVYPVQVRRTARWSGFAPS